MLGRAGLICGLVANVYTSPGHIASQQYRPAVIVPRSFFEEFVVIACPQKFEKSTEPTDEFKA
jgi:hypothetical protein